MTAPAQPLPESARGRAREGIQARVLNVEQAAAYMGTNRNEIYRLTRLGELPNFHLFDGAPQRWLKDDLDAYMDARRKQASSNLTLVTPMASGQRKPR